MSSHISPPWAEIPKGPKVFKGTMWCFYLSSWSSSSSSPLVPPPGSFLPSASTATDTGAFKGGLGMMGIVRYTDSLVGPYDELFLIPGSFSHPALENKGEGEKVHQRLTNVWVSKQEAIDLGEYHLNTPKRLAHFTFTSLSPSSLSVTISTTPTSPPFFRAILTTPAFLPLRLLPLNLFRTALTYVPWLGSSTGAGGTTFVQPPLVPTPQGRKGHEWIRFESRVKGGKAKLVWIEGALESEKGGGEGSKTMGNGVEFPRGLDEVWTLGFCFEGARMILEEGKRFFVQ